MPVNMAHVRFINTLVALRECSEHMDDDTLSAPEKSARADLIKLCRRIAEVIEDQAAALEYAYGILWRMPDAATGHARKVLLEAIGPEGQKRGIARATKIYGPATESEMLAASR